MAKDTEQQAAIRRKADAIERAGGDPAKVTELRFSLPAERKTLADVQTTATATVPADGSESHAETTAEAKATPKPGRPRLAATRGMDTTKAKTSGK